MARMDPQDRGPRIEHLVHLGLQFLAEVLKQWAQPRLQALARPDQLLAEGGEGGAAALAAFDQWLAEELAPFLDQVPDMAIGHPGACRRGRDFSGRTNFREDVQRHLQRLRIRASPELPHGQDSDLDHASPMIWTSYQAQPSS